MPWPTASGKRNVTRLRLAAMGLMSAAPAVLHPLRDKPDYRGLFADDIWN